MDFLKNYLFIIVGVLIVIILIVLYFMSNDLRKNKNKINILEANLNALTERVQNMNSKAIASQDTPAPPTPSSSMPNMMNMNDPRLSDILPMFTQSMMRRSHDDEDEDEEEEDDEEYEDEDEEEEEEDEDEEEEEDEEEDEEEEDDDDVDKKKKKKTQL
jgi:type IV secretory pathway VirB10-like protein